MNLRDLQYLVALADHRHFGKAAEQSHISQPTLSMQLRKLEDSLGVILVERTNKQVVITPIGKEIAERARLVLRGAQEIRQAARMAQDPSAGDFRLGAFPTLAPYFLPLAAPLIGKKLPRLKLLLVEEKTRQLVDGLVAGTLDAALLALPVDEEYLETAPLFDEPFMLAVPAGHPFSKRKQIGQEDIRGETLLLLEEGHCLRSQALELCSLIGAAEHQDFRATSLETLRQMVAAGVGMTLIPKLAMRKNDGIVYLPFAKPGVSRTVGLAWRKTSARRQCIDTLVGLLSHTISK